MFEKIKLFIWTWNSSKKCPFCNGKLLPHFKENYTCPKENCEFNK